MLAKTIPIAIEKTKNLTFNIIGSCADDFNYFSDLYEIKRILKKSFNAEPICILTSDTSVSHIEAMGSAHINIVLRSEGINAAKTLESRFGTPYVFGKPYGLKGTLQWIEKISQTLKVNCNYEFINSEVNELEKGLKAALSYNAQFKNSSVVIGGHIDVVSGLVGFLRDEAGFTLCHAWCNSPNMATETIPFYKENQWEEIIKTEDYKILMGNAVALNLSKNQCKKIQIDIPNYEFHFLKYPYTPYVGFRGALYLLNKCLNP